jgi:hypothetical protein
MASIRKGVLPPIKMPDAQSNSRTGHRDVPDTSIETFYDSLAPITDGFLRIGSQRHSPPSLLDAVIREIFGTHVRQILNGMVLARKRWVGGRGYHLTAPISSAEIELARGEAIRRGLTVDFRVADMRQLWAVHQRQFDAIIACDNAIPHLLSDADILVAFEQFYRCTLPDGGCIISVRDYAAMERGGRQFYPRIIHDTDKGRMVLFDVGVRGISTIHHLYHRRRGKPCTYTCRPRGPLLLRNDRDSGATVPAGWVVEVRTLKDRFFQPLIVALGLSMLLVAMKLVIPLK